MALDVLLAESDNNEARGAELDNKSMQVAEARADLRAETEARLANLVQVYADNKAETAARMLLNAETPAGAAQILVRLDAARQTELLEQIESQQPDEFKAYYDAFSQALASKTQTASR